MFSKYTCSLAVCCLLLTSTCIASSYRDFYPDDIDETESTAANALEIGNSNINSYACLFLGYFILLTTYQCPN